MSKPITISLQNLNALYFKFLNHFVVQYLPKDIYNNVTNLLSLKSAVQSYRFLDKLLSSTEDKKLATAMQQRKISSTAQDKKLLNSIQDKKENLKRLQTYQQKSNASNQGTASYVDKQDFKYQNDLNTLMKPPLLLKKTNTYQSPEQKVSGLNYESLNIGLAKAKDTLNKQPLNNLNATTNINVVKHDFDTVSEKQNSLGHVGLIKRDSQDSRGMGNNINTIGDGYSLKRAKDRESREKSDQNLYNTERKKTELSKRYSIRETQPKAVNCATINNTVSSTATPNGYQQSSGTVINRVGLQNVIKQTRQIFSENAKKIARYQKISNQLPLRQDKPLNDIYSGFSNQTNSNNFTYMYKKY